RRLRGLRGAAAGRGPRTADPRPPGVPRLLLALPGLERPGPAPLVRPPALDLRRPRAGRRLVHAPRLQAARPGAGRLPPAARRRERRLMARRKVPAPRLPAPPARPIA